MGALTARVCRHGRAQIEAADDAKASAGERLGSGLCGGFAVAVIQNAFPMGCFVIVHRIRLFQCTENNTDHLAPSGGFRHAPNGLWGQMADSRWSRAETVVSLTPHAIRHQ